MAERRGNSDARRSGVEHLEEVSTRNGAQIFSKLEPFTISFTKVWSLKTSRMFSWARESIAQWRLKA